MNTEGSNISNDLKLLLHKAPPFESPLYTQQKTFRVYDDD